jgi:hypothetical protein
MTYHLPPPPGFGVPPEVCGPKMQALRDDRQRRFAFLMGCGETNATEAAREAGYPDTSGAAKTRGWELMQREDILSAVREVAGRVLGGLAPIAIAALRNILRTPKHPAHARMIETVLDRTGYLAAMEQRITVEHVDDGRLRELVARIAVEIGVDAVKLLGRPVIEGEVADEPQKLPVGNGGGSGGGIGDGG